MILTTKDLDKMNLIKIILIGIGIFIAVMLGFTLVGIVYSALWYLFWIGVIAIAGTAAYKLLKKPEAAQIENKEPIFAPSGRGKLPNGGDGNFIAGD